ncbi:MAG: T9SS type A sorting domain-containing protein, partial [Aureispira sp.]|nr:T9SS type A sorting domain-containing protein [Aureispira sp.]
ISYIFEITGAAMSPNQEQLALLGANTVWWFTGFTGNHFFDGMVQTISLNSTTQKEALDFVDNQRLYFSNESSFLGSAALGELNLSSLITSNSLVVEQRILDKVFAYPNPTNKQLNLEFELYESAKVSIQLLDVEGKIAQRFPSKTLSAGKQLLDLPIDTIPTGIYFLRLKCGPQKYTKRIVIAR